MLDPEIVADCIKPGGGRVGLTIAQRLSGAMWNRVHMTWGELLGAIGVPGCAKSVMESIAQAFPDPESLKQAGFADLSKVSGVGAKRAMTIASFIEERWDDIIEPLLEVISITNPSGNLVGKTFCITLGLNRCSRSQMIAEIKARGGQVKGSVSKSVTHLVCNFPESSSTKLAKAKEYGIPIISEDELINMMGGLDISEPEVNPDDEF